MHFQEGLRERKKRATRETILVQAMALFGEHGYDAVTVADVARAAGVSEKTVFNYFPAKEDLVFNAGQARREALIDAIRARPAGESLVEPFRRQTEELIARVELGPDRGSSPCRASWPAAPCCASGCSSAGSARRRCSRR